MGFATLLLLIGFLIGFPCGYGIRASLSRQRRAAAERRRKARRSRYMTLEVPRITNRRHEDGFE
jgi:hypothetical protein